MLPSDAKISPRVGWIGLAEVRVESPMRFQSSACMTVVLNRLTAIAIATATQAMKISVKRPTVYCCLVPDLG